MNTYIIPEVNMEKLKQKLAAVERRCKKLDKPFTYREVGESFETKFDDLGDEVLVKFIHVEVEGHAVLNGWRFIASIQHLPAGRLISKANPEDEIPDRFFGEDAAICEHCNTRRTRKDTYIVFNEETKEYKQVGKSCLKDYTNGMSAELVAAYLQYFKDLEDSQSWDSSCSIGRTQSYYSIEELLCYAAECTRCFGFTPTTGYGYSTAALMWDHFAYDNFPHRLNYEEKEHIRKAIEKHHFDATREDARRDAKETLEYYRSIEDNGNDYTRNLKVLLGSDFINGRNWGLLASAVHSYHKAMDHKKKVEAAKARNAALTVSQYRGQIGKKVEFVAESVKCVSSWSNQWGYTYLYQMLDKDNNVFVWYASNHLSWEDTSTEGKRFNVSGTVKEHKQYKDIKQTILTRCKVTEIKEQTEPAPYSGEVEVAMDMFMAAANG